VTRLLILCGPAFSGKTTLSRALALRGWTRISPDEILRAKGMDPGDGLPDSVWGQALEEVCARIEALVGAGPDGVLDDTSCYRWLRDRYRQTARQCGIEVALAVLRVDRDEVRRRVAANARHGHREGIRDDVLRAHLDSFEWPMADEAGLELDALWNVERQIEALRGVTFAPGTPAS
jgi:predicted kinase